MTSLKYTVWEETLEWNALSTQTVFYSSFTSQIILAQGLYKYGEGAVGVFSPGTSFDRGPTIVTENTYKFNNTNIFCGNSTTVIKPYFTK